MLPLNRWIRKWHRWGAFIFAIPLAVVVVSGVLLQIKKQVTWVQPPTRKASVVEDAPHVEWKAILAAAKSIPESNVNSWEDIDRLDVRPSRGIVKIQCVNHWELQVDACDGTLLSSCYRRSDWIEGLHDGSLFGEWVKLGIFLPNGLMLAFLWASGLYLWYLPIRSWRKKKMRDGKK